MISISGLIKQSGISHKEAVLLVAFVIKKPKEYIIAHDDFILSKRQQNKIKKLFLRRKNHEPIAYLTGKKEFYGRELLVTPDVLVPRPETENLIEVVKTITSSEPKKIIDIGTGSGCIGITLKLERPELDITLSDVSSSALKIAKTNVKRLGAKVHFLHSNLLQNVSKYTKYDIIIANLPYVNPAWKTSPELKYEPKFALFAEDGGLKIIKKLVETASSFLTQDGYLILELDPCQHQDIVTFAEQFGFKKHLEQDYVLALKV